MTGWSSQCKQGGDIAQTITTTNTRWVGHGILVTNIALALDFLFGTVTMMKTVGGVILVRQVGWILHRSNISLSQSHGGGIIMTKYVRIDDWMMPRTTITITSIIIVSS